MEEHLKTRNKLRKNGQWQKLDKESAHVEAQEFVTDVSEINVIYLQPQEYITDLNENQIYELLHTSKRDYLISLILSAVIRVAIILLVWLFVYRTSDSNLLFSINPIIRLFMIIGIIFYVGLEAFYIRSKSREASYAHAAALRATAAAKLKGNN